jgi:hypothetical protein
LRKRKGQILLLSVLGIVIIMLSISTLLIKTSILPLDLSQPKYREKITQIYFGSQATISKGLADVSNNLHACMQLHDYKNCTSSVGEKIGFDVINDWQRDVMKNNHAAGVCVNFSIPMFECEWNDTIERRGYSLARSNVSIALNSMGFEGLEDEINIEFKAELLELIESDGRETTFKIRFSKEKDEPVDKMPRSLVSVIFESYNRSQPSKSYIETNTGAVRNLGNGTFLVTYLSNTNNITRNLKILRDNITQIPPGSLISHKTVSGSVPVSWSHISCIRDINTLYLYVDGAQVDIEDISGYGSISNDRPVIIGTGGPGSSITIDEIRFCKTPKLDKWVETVYNTYSPGFVSIGTRENITQNGWQYMRTLSIDSGLVPYSQSNVPVLVRLSSSFDYDLANTSGKDIRFNQSGVDLPYEIEKWEYGGDSYIWVQVQSISSGSDTTFQMYYGNPSAPDVQNSIVLWGDYSFVHHLEETSGTADDSTGNDNDGTYSGSSMGDSGKIDGGCGFYGNDNMDIDHSDSTDPGSGEFFISLWADIQNNDNTTIISKWFESENIGYRLFVNDEEENLVFMIDDNDDNATKSNLLRIIDEVESNYTSGERVLAHGRLLELRDRLNPESDQTDVEEGYNTGEILDLVDRLLDQLRPIVRVVARDQRGITVSTYGELTSSTDDIYGPTISDQEVQPIQCGYNETISLEAKADDRWYGNSSIEEVEYFISDNKPEGQTGNGEYMEAVDGNYDESLEEVEEVFSSNILNSGLNNIWIHAKDSEGNWGPYVMLQVNLVPDSNLHIEISGFDKGCYWSWRYWRYIYWAKVTVLATDGEGVPLQDVNIHGVWSGVVNWSGYGLTDESGTYEFIAYRTSIWYITENEFTFIADSASKTGYTWDGGTAEITIWVP